MPPAQRPWRVPEFRQTAVAGYCMRTAQSVLHDLWNGVSLCGCYV
jgi:hypothetical protein